MTINAWLAWSKHPWKRGVRKIIATSVAKADRGNLDPHRQLRLGAWTPSQERRACVCNTASPGLAVDATLVPTSTNVASQREATPRVQDLQRLRRAKGKGKAKAKIRDQVEAVTEVNSALTVQTGLRYLL